MFVRGVQTDDNRQCRSWDDNEEPRIMYTVSEGQNFCRFPDYNYGEECGGYKRPWSYVKNGNQLERFGVCEIKKCKCGQTGLLYNHPLGGQFKVPDNLNYLKGDNYADDHFRELIDYWNDNVPLPDSELLLFRVKLKPIESPESDFLCSFLTFNQKKFSMI